MAKHHIHEALVKKTAIPAWIRQVGPGCGKPMAAAQEAQKSLKLIDKIIHM
jgi:hypothetical protein